MSFKGAPGKFDPAHHPVDIYVLASNGATNLQIAQQLGLTAPTIDYWIEHYESVQYALKLARPKNGRSRAEEFKEYVYNRLSPDMKVHWDYINIWCEHPNGATRIEALLQPLGTEVRQSLWLHAMMHTNFNSPEACRMVNISRKQLNSWTQNDPDFSQLLDEIVWAKKHFFEGALIKLVAEGNVMATIFANKTQNSDLGYNEKTVVQHRHSGSVGVDVQHSFHVSIDKLNLPLDVRRQVLDAIRATKKLEQAKTVADDSEAIDVEPVAPVLRPGRIKLASSALAAIGED